MWVARRAEMHALMFRLKRAFHRSLAHVRPLIADFGLTPARFDMLKVIDSGSSSGFILQSWIRRALGVSRATVSRMLKSLEALGFVVRTPDLDKRERRVALTKEGRRRFDEAASDLIVSGAIDLSFAGALTRTPDWPQRHEHAAQALERLDAIRAGFRDGADDYVYRISSWFCPDHPTQRPLGPAFDDVIEADAFAGICIRGLLIRQRLAASRL